MSHSRYLRYLAHSSPQSLSQGLSLSLSLSSPARRVLSLSIAAIGLFIMLAMPKIAYADGTITVDTVADEFGAGASCSLREAIQSANTDSDFGGCTRTDTPPYTLELSAGEFTLSQAGANEDANATGDLDIGTSLTIVGDGAGDTFIQAGATSAAAIDRVIHILAGATVNISDVTIRYGATPADGNGGGIANIGGILTLSDSVVRDNVALGDGPGEGGGGIFNDANSSLTLNATNVLSNSALVNLGNGGGILTAPGSTLVINGGQIENNAAARAGGGIENNAGNATFTNLTLNGNTTGLNGAGLHISGAGTVTMTGGTASENVAGKEGGALWNSGPGLLTVDNVTIEENIASGDDADQGGGGLFSDGGDLIVRNSTISNNSANGISGSGGGILIVPGSALTVTDSTITDNTAMRAGGGIEVAANMTATVTALLENVQLTQNDTGSNPGNGGALHITGPGTVIVNGGNVSENTASAEGGGLWNSASGTLIVDGVTLSNNVASGAAADQGGGALFSDGGKLTVLNSTISGNSADGTSGSGGGILVVPGSALTVTESILTDNSALRAGGGIEVNAIVTRTVVAVLTNVDLEGNTTGANPGNGGALHITGPGTVTVNGGTVIENTASAEGGGLWNSASGSLTVNGTTLRGNIASGAAADQGGGALFNDGGTMIVAAALIENNVANGTSGSGGGILAVPGSQLSVMNSNLVGNSATRAGGGIEVNALITRTVVATLDNVDMQSNTTGANPGNGGALHITGPATVSVMGGEVISNTASAEGGGLWNSAAGVLTVDGTLFRANIASGAAADQGGGALFSDGGKLTVQNSTINSNVANGAAGSGGGILVVPGSALTVTNSTLSQNTAVRAGGGIEVAATVTKTVSALLNDVDLLQNATGNTPGNGGALHITGPGTVTVLGSTITGNTASAEGGGLWNSASGTLTVDKSTLSGNTATGAAADHGGGGLYNDGGVLNVSNSTISGNSAQATGGGVLSVAGTTTIINATIYENSAASGAGGINSAAGTTTIANSIVAHSAATGADCAGVTANSENLDSDGTCQATVTADPKLGPLQLNGGTTFTHELLTGSPAINAGDNAICAAAPINNVDQRGQVRPFGVTCDLGAYELSGLTIIIRLFFPAIALP